MTNDNVDSGDNGNAMTRMMLTTASTTTHHSIQHVQQQCISNMIMNSSDNSNRSNKSNDNNST